MQHPKLTDESAEELRFFASTYLHNLNAPLAGLKMLVQMFREKPEVATPEVIESYIQGSSNLFEVIADLNENLGDLMRINQGWEPEKVTEMVAEVSSDPELSGLSLQLKCPDDCLVSFPEPLIRIICKEIFSNSLRFAQSDEAPKLTLTVENRDGWDFLKFEDNSRGFDSAAVQDKLFKPYRKFLNDPAVEGRGMGLFRIKTIVGINGGQLSLKSQAGHGMQIKLWLPKN